jgi:uncharacterized protein (DUF1697 family)
MLKMSDLKACLERAGLENVVTYINSGNVGFDADSDESSHVASIEKAIETEFNKQIPVMVRLQAEIIHIMAANPFAGQFDSHKEMHVLFLKEEMPSEKFDQLLAASTPPERFVLIGRELYCHLPLGVADSILGKSFIEKKLKVAVTGRNWRTVEKLSTL